MGCLASILGLSGDPLKGDYTVPAVHFGPNKKHPYILIIEIVYIVALIEIINHTKIFVLFRYQSIIAYWIEHTPIYLSSVLGSFFYTIFNDRPKVTIDRTRRTVVWKDLGF